jgi:predicted DNA-binding transcriptional regulator AlpA
METRIDHTQETLLTLPEVKLRTGKSTSVIYEEMAAGTFPRPLKRGRQSIWIASEVQAVINREIATLPRMGRNMGARQAKKNNNTKSAG